MEQVIVSVILVAALIYLICGLVFSVFFVSRGAQTIDGDVPGSSRGFRLIIIPGCILLWPVLLRKWINALNKEK